MITSAHKTLPAYSQAALLLARTERLDASRLDRAFDALHTTSPAGTIMASMDAARALLEHDGERLLSRTIEAVAEARSALRRVPGVEVLDGDMVDAAKLTVSIAGTGAHGVEVESDLMAAGVPVEMADRDTIVAIATIADDERALRRFTVALTESVEFCRGPPRPVTASAAWIVAPQQRVAPREAFFGVVETVPFAEAAGRVSAELVALYPPGVPVLAPGELVTEETLAALTDAAADGVRIAYAADPALVTLEVLADTRPRQH
jgi:arginine decarboxylase